ncbi:MAG: hypothetical protein D6715_05160 [Calditrichaeota bacterium]|nr:MAG: hypothetical protein D6715_05160 [Calditrichota bacterium]
MLLTGVAFLAAGAASLQAQTKKETDLASRPRAVVAAPPQFNRSLISSAAETTLSPGTTAGPALSTRFALKKQKTPYGETYVVMRNGTVTPRLVQGSAATMAMGSTGQGRLPSGLAQSRFFFNAGQTLVASREGYALIPGAAITLAILRSFGALSSRLCHQQVQAAAFQGRVLYASLVTWWKLHLNEASCSPAPLALESN